MQSCRNQCSVATLRNAVTPQSVQCDNATQCSHAAISAVWQRNAVTPQSVQCGNTTQCSYAAISAVWQCNAVMPQSVQCGNATLCSHAAISAVWQRNTMLVWMDFKEANQKIYKFLFLPFSAVPLPTWNVILKYWKSKATKGGLFWVPICLPPLL